jgi:hypothetical protein
LAATIALLLAAGGIWLAWQALTSTTGATPSSADAGRVVFTGGGEQGHDIFAADLVGSDQERLTGVSAQEDDPSQAP